MANEIQLRIVTPRRQVLDQAVLEVTAPGTVGEFGVLPNHATFLGSLEIGRLSYRDARGLHHLAVRGGFAEVSDNVMTVLADAAEPSAEVDPARAKSDLAAAEAAMADLSPLDPACEAAAAEARWARARLDAGQKA
jgi:F-type H+-transporting ATPase subunit epsilon